MTKYRICITYTIETVVASGLRGQKAAKEAAQRHANRLGQSVWLTNSEGHLEEIGPDDSVE